MAESQLSVYWKPKEDCDVRDLPKDCVLHEAIDSAGSDEEKAATIAEIITNEKQNFKLKNKKIRKKLFNNFLNLKDSQGQRPLYRAVKQGLLECVRIIMSHGADPNLMSTKYKLTPVMVAAQLGNHEIVLHLVTSGADLTLKNKLGNHALMIACETGNNKCVQVLLDHGAPLELKNKARETPLMVATRCGKIECIKTLLAAGANIHVVGRYDENNIVPCFAVRDGHIDALRVILNHDQEALEKWKASSKQKILTEILLFDQLSMLKMLLDEYAWSLASTKHFQALHLATSSHYGSPPVKDCLKFLLENREKFHLDINETRHKDFGHDMATPLHTACDSTSYEVMNLLFEHGADPDRCATRLDRDSYSEPEKLRYYTPLATCLSSLYLNECEYGCDVPYLICAVKILRYGCNVLLHLGDTLSATFRDFPRTVWCRSEVASYPFDATVGHVLGSSVPCRIGRVLMKMIFVSICDDKQPFRTGLYNLNFFQTEQLPTEDEFLDNINKWGWTEFFMPCSLMDLSRDVVRKSLHRNIEVKVAQLDIPPSMKKYLNLDELDDLKDEYIKIFDNEVDDHLVEMNRNFYDRENRKNIRERDRPNTVEGFYYMNGFSDNMYSSDDSTENDQENQFWSSEDE